MFLTPSPLYFVMFIFLFYFCYWYCGLRIFCVHFCFRSFGLTKLLQFDNRDILTSFIFRISFLTKHFYVVGFYNYSGNTCLSPLKMWVEPCSWRGVLDTTLHDQVCQWLATGRWFSPGILFSSTNKTDRNDVTEILLKVALNTINPKPLELHFWTNFPIYLVWRQMYLV